MRWHGLLSLTLLLCAAGVFAVGAHGPRDAATTAPEHGHPDAQSDIPARAIQILLPPTLGDSPSSPLKNVNVPSSSTKEFSEPIPATTPTAITEIAGTNVPADESKVIPVVPSTTKPVDEHQHEDNEIHVRFGIGVEDEPGIGHCDPAFPPPLHHEKKLEDNDISTFQELVPSNAGSPTTESVVHEINIQEQKNERETDSNDEKTEEEHLGEGNVFSEESSEETNVKTESLNVLDGYTETFEVLPTAASFVEKHSQTHDNKRENDIRGASTFENPKSDEEDAASHSVAELPVAAAQIRRLDDNKFAFPIPSLYDLEHSTTETTVRKDIHQDDLSSREIHVQRHKGSGTPPYVPQPSAVRFTPTHVHRYEYETEQGNNDDASTEQDAGDVAETTAKPSAGKPRGRLAPATPPDPPPAPTLEFPPLPPGEDFRVNDLGLSDGVFVFKYLGSFLSWIQPYDFPVELLRDALWKRVSVANLIGQSLPVEAGFVACLCVGVLLALAAPLYVILHACCSLCRKRRDASPSANATSSSWDDDSSSEASSGCRRRALLFMLDVILLLMVGGVVAMFVTNEQLTGAVSRSPATIHTALGDAATFLRNTNLQLHFVVTKSLDRAVEAASTDLDNVESLLGKPIQRQLEEETGVGVALEALVDVTTSAQAVAGRVAGLLERAAEARGLALVAQERLADLRLQVDALRRQCPTKDRSLCDTVEAQGLSITMYLDGLLSDERLSVLRRVAEGNLSATAQQARGEFLFIPTHVEQQTRDARSGVRRQLLRQRGLLDDSAWSLDALSRELIARVEEARERAIRVADSAADVEYWRYMAAIGMAAAVLLLWTLLLAALSCGCCGAEEKARPTLFTWVGILCPVYLALWAAALVALLVGGHGEVFVCRPLYDEPGFDALTALVDRPGVLFQRRSGFFANMVHGGNTTLDVPLKEALRACEQNRPSYPAFRLQQVLDVDSATDHRRWEHLHRQLGRLAVDLSQLQLLTPQLQMQLTSLLNAAHVNLTSHRTQLSRPVTGKDLTTFADQLESVANQITDLPTASRLETLASRTRRLLASHMDPLKQRKEDLVYQLTALEVQLVPLQRQVNESLSHLKTIQFFINSQGSNISNTKSNEYADRLVSYIQQYREHVMRVTSESAAPCRPLWDSFHAVRQLLCRHIMDPLNGFWFGAVWCLVLLLAAAPLAVRLGECYPRSRPHPLLHRSAAETPPDPPAMPEQATWSTPGYVHKMYRAQSSDTINTDSFELYDKKF